jgi:putative PIG3 family NAD(P)H quinone oxidoreductase
MQFPSLMHAIEIQSERLVPVLRAVPVIKSDEVLIKVFAAGINRPDVQQRKGLYLPPPDVTDIPGLEVAGSICQLGNKNEQWQLGDYVCALVPGGGYAEYCAANAQLCMPIPDNLSFIEAAGIPETFFTVWHNVFERGALKNDEAILIHGGTSGIGTTAIQLAKAAGATIFTTAGTDEKCDFCMTLGANHAINYNRMDFVNEVLKITEQQGVNIILDMIGGNYFSRNLNCLADDGRLLQIAIQNGPKAELNLWRLMLKRWLITGSTLRSRDINVKSAIARALLKNVWPLLSSGRVKPIIHSTFKLKQAQAAHDLMESGQHQGKIILEITP